MKTRSLRQVHNQLNLAWSRDVEIELRRTGSREFEVGVDLAPVEGFEFGRGWALSSREYSSTERLDPPRATHGMGAKIAGVVGIVVLVIFCLTAAVEPIFLAVQHLASSTRAVNSVTSLTKSSSGHTANDNRDAKGTSCDVAPILVQPVPAGTSQSSGLTVTLLHDITIGGERLQEVAFVCPSNIDPKTSVIGYNLRFALIKGVWKAKSATPTGSHSRFETN